MSTKSTLISMGYYASHKFLFELKINLKPYEVFSNGPKAVDVGLFRASNAVDVERGDRLPSLPQFSNPMKASHVSTLSSTNLLTVRRKIVILRTLSISLP